MNRILLSLCAAALAAAALAGGAAAGRHARPTLVGTVGPGFTITLTLKGKPVKILKAGTYRLVVRDRSTIHSFSLTGPKGFAKDVTTVPFTGRRTAILKLKRGAYTFFCPPHATSMVGKFRVK